MMVGVLGSLGTGLDWRSRFKILGGRLTLFRGFTIAAQGSGSTGFFVDERCCLTSRCGQTSLSKNRRSL